MTKIQLFPSLPGFTAEVISEFHTVADHATAPGRFVLAKHDNGSYFTIWQNLQTGGCSSGHYDLANFSDGLANLRGRTTGTVWDRMNDRIKFGTVIEITRGGRTVRGRVTRAKLPSNRHQDGFFDLEYDILGMDSRLYAERHLVPTGRWKQQADGGTVKIIKDA
jgi:hypothetical protein